MAASLQLLRAQPPAVVPFLCRGKIYLPFRRDQTKRYKLPPIKLDPLRNKNKKEVPLFFGRHKTRHPVEQAGGSLTWAEPIFAAYKKRLENPESVETEPEEKAIPKLHAVQRVPKTLYGVNKTLKKIMKALGLHPDQVQRGEFVILPNTEIINEHLRQVKGLVRIQPLTFPHGEPKDESDLPHIHLTDNAQVVVRQKLHAIDVQDSRNEDIWAIQKDTIVRSNRRRIQQQRVSLEYFPPRYTYKFNQDGKEHRYTHNLPKNDS